MWLVRSLPPIRSHLRRPASARGRSILQLGGSSPPASTSATDVDDRFNRDPACSTSAAAAGAWPSLSNRPDFCNGCGSNQLLQRQRHLYLALDDWENGFSLHKLSFDDLLRGDAADGELRRLPDPVLRLAFVTVGSDPSFHALGSNIVVRSDSYRFSGLTLVYNTETAALDICNSLKQHLHCTYHATAAGDKLFTFDFDSSKGLYLGPTRSTINGCGYPDGNEVSRRWIWERIPVPPPFTRHGDGYISATALHPDGRTIFVSVRSDFALGLGSDLESKQERERKLLLGTFSLDTESGEWTRRGDWCMPFEGQAHYDGELGAWIGTNTVYDKEDQSYHEHLFCCDVPDLGKGSTQAPAWKVATEKLTFFKASLSSTDQPVLVSTGGGMFSLIERTIREGFGFTCYRGDGDKWQLHVTMFRVKYGKNGELVVAPVLPGRSYLMSRYLANFKVPAFWI